MRRRTTFLLLAGLVLAGCTRSPTRAYTTYDAPTTTSVPVAPQAPAAIAITGARFDVHSAAPGGPGPVDATWAGVLDTLNRYLETAVLGPLRSAGLAGDLTPVFSPSAVPRIDTGGPDRATFVDEGMGAPATDLRAEAAVAALSALVGPDRTLSVVAAELDLRLTGRMNGSPFSLARTGELVLMPEGGTWRIDTWDLKATRSLPEATTTTTARW